MIVFIGDTKTDVLTQACEVLKGEAYAFMTFFVLLRRVRPNGQCWPSLKRIAEDTGFDRKTVIRAMDTLVKTGLIARIDGKSLGFNSKVTKIRL